MSPAQAQTPIIANCSFCQKPNTEVGRLVAGPGVFICDGCVQLASDVMTGTPVSESPVAPWDMELSLEATLAFLGPVAAEVAQVERNLRLWVDKARSRGATWAQVGQALGVTRQSAWEKFSGEE